MKALEVFHPYVLTDVMGCPIPTVNHRIVMAARDFCDRTSAWREWLDVFTADGDTDTFDHDLNSNQELIRYTRAVLNDDEEGEYDIVSRKDLPPDWATNASTQLVDTIVHLNEAQFQVFPMPEADDTIRMEAVFKPRIAATQLPDVLFDRYAEAIAHGALSRLLVLPGMPWSNPKLADFHGGQFESAVHAAANEGFRHRKDKRVKPSPL